MNPTAIFPGLGSAEAAAGLKPFKFPPQPWEYKVQPMRECAVQNQLCDTPELCRDYWHEHVTAHPYFNPEVECLVVLMLNTRRRIKGHYLVATGTSDQLLGHAREIFRLAIMVSAGSIVMMHNHPSGDPSPSEADLRITRDIARSGQLLKIELLDHIIIGRPGIYEPSHQGYYSMRESGQIFVSN